MGSLRYIFGGAGYGKTHFIFSDINEYLRHSDNTSLIYIVPEQFSLLSEKELLKYSGEHANIQAQVLSFPRLAYHIFAKEGHIKGKYLDEIGKHMLLRKIVIELRESLTFYKNALDKQGFMDNLCGIISEIYKYGQGIELTAYANSLPENNVLYYKMQDLSLIFKSFTDYLQEQYIATDAMLDLLADKIESSSFLNDAIVYIDEFYSFTPQEYRVISKILKTAKRVNLALTLKDCRIKFDNLKISDPFFELKATVNKVSRLALDNSIEIENPIFLTEDIRHKNAEQLSFLEDHYLNFAPCIYKGENRDIIINESAIRNLEVQHTAEAIIELVMQGYNFNDIAILTSALEDYSSGIEYIFSQFEIPFFIDRKQDILSHPLTELIRSAIDIVALHWNYESVFRFLKTGFTGIDRESIDILENYVLAYDIKWNKWQKEKWIYGFDKGFDEETIMNCRNQLINSLKYFTVNIKGESKRTVKEFSERIFKMLDSLDVQARLYNLIEDMEKIGNREMIMQHSQIWGKVCGIFDKVVEILGEEQVTVKEFGKIVEAGFKNETLGLIPPTQDQIIIGDFERTRLSSVKSLFVLGVNEGLLPSIKNEEGLLLDDERILLNSIGLELAPDSKRRSYHQQFLIYNGICRPSEKLYISYCLGTTEGKPMRQSSIITKLKKMFPDIVKQTSFNNIVLRPKPIFAKMGEILKSYITTGEITEENAVLYKWFLTQEPYRIKLDKMENLLFEKVGKEYLSNESVKKLYGKEIITGISRLEKYVQCPFAFFLQYNIKAKDRPLYQLQSVDIGNLFHRVLEEFAGYIGSNDLTWRHLEQSTIDRFVDNCMGTVENTVGNEVLMSTARYRYISQRISRICKKSIWALSQHITKGKFEIFDTEVEFRADNPLSGIVVEINGNRKMLLTGRIDRVDIMDSLGKRYVKIIDYKSGNKKFDLDDIYFGVQLQLMLYIDAFIKNGESVFKTDKIEAKLLPGGVFYFNIDDPILEYDGDYDEETLNESILKTFRMSGLLLNDEDVIYGLDSEISKSSAIIPVSINAKGEVKGNSSLMELDEFNELRQSVNEKIKEIGNRLVDGNINIAPYKKNNITGCDYCEFKTICRFDIAGGKYNYAQRK